MIRFVTLLAVPGADSSTGEECPFPPKESFHLEAFFTTAGVAGGRTGDDDASTVAGWGSMRTVGALEDAILAARLMSMTGDDTEVERGREEERDAKLISLARVCEAEASTSKVSSTASLVNCLLLRAPRRPRFFVERLRPSSKSCSASALRSGSTSISSAGSTSSMISIWEGLRISLSDSSTTEISKSGTVSKPNPVFSNAGPNEGARDKLREWMTGVRPPARDEGRREGGQDDKG